MSVSDQKMTSNRPYLVRAIHEWINDNLMTPHLLVDAGFPGVQVPRQAIKDGQVVLNVAPQAVAHLELGNDEVRFMARFSGASMQVRAPLGAVLAIYAKETGQGMMLPPENESSSPAAVSPVGVASDDAGTDHPAPDDDAPKRPKLRVVK